MNLERAYERRPGVVGRRIAGETILVPTTRRAHEMALFTLNEVGTFVWERLDPARPAEALVADIVAEFDVESEKARADLEHFLDQMIRSQCIREASS